MLKILEKTAKTEEDAVAAALEELGVTLEKVKVEVNVDHEHIHYMGD